MKIRIAILLCITAVMQASIVTLEQAVELVEHLQEEYANNPEMVYEAEAAELLAEIRAFLENHTGSLAHELLLKKVAELEEKIAAAEENAAFKGTRRVNKLKVNELRVYNMTLDGSLTHGSATFLLPETVGIAGQVLATSGTNPDQLYWTTVQTSSGGATGISCDTPNTLVLRDNTGSFVATTLTLTGDSLINYSAVGGCDTGSGYIWAPENGNTLIGLGAGSALAEGASNVALGFQALAAGVANQNNIAIGAYALNSSQNDINQIAIGYNALANFNADPSMIGNPGNIGIGTNALVSLLSGESNIAIGYNSAQNYISNEKGNIILGDSDQTGDNNMIRIGYLEQTQTQTCFILGINTAVSGSGISGVGNAIPVLVDTNSQLAVISQNTDTLLGYYALNYAPINQKNTAVGYYTLHACTTGTDNVAVGYNAGSSITGGSNNTLIGSGAGSSVTSINNTIIGAGAGSSVTTAQNVIIIGEGLAGANTSRTTYIDGIYNTAGTGNAVSVTASGQLVAPSSSRKYKENIDIIPDAVSEQIHNLQPVTFTYKQDGDKHPQYGLIAEEVHAHIPAMTLYKDGEIDSINYAMLPILILNEYQKDHRLIQELQQQVADLQKVLNELHFFGSRNAEQA